MLLQWRNQMRFPVLLRLILISLALGLEIHGLRLILSESMAEENLVEAASCHFIASVVAAYIFPQIIRPDHHGTRLRNCIFFFMLTFYLPVMGLIGLILAMPMVAVWSSKKSEKLDQFVRVSKIRDLPSEVAVTIGQPINPHSLFDLYSSRNPDRRLQAVYATLKLKDRDAIPLLRMALGDAVDDIRLLAYALLDRKEYRLSKRIEQAKQDVDKQEDTGKKQLYRQIANDYWELAHLGLVQGEAKNYVLSMAFKYIELGLGYAPEDSGLLFQYAQILLRLGKYQKAFEEFKKAEMLGMEFVCLQTYYAEIAFYTRRYYEVKQLMAAIELPAAYPVLTTAARFWRKEI
jgi:polysaccharide biosynthesis protein PelE